MYLGQFLYSEDLTFFRIRVTQLEEKKFLINLLYLAVVNFNLAKSIENS